MIDRASVQLTMAYNRRGRIINDLLREIERMTLDADVKPAKPLLEAAANELNLLYISRWWRS